MSTEIVVLISTRQEDLNRILLETIEKQVWELL
jgi:hypothetical protein